MYKIIIVEDNPDAAKQLTTCISGFLRERGEEGSVVHYPEPEEFLSRYESDTDIVFMDIDFGGLSRLNGMEAARLLREKDQQVILIFITNLAQFAVKGYEVNALDFALKPIRYPDISRKLTRAFDKLKRDSDTIAILYDGSIVRIPIKDIQYIEVSNHKLSFHTDTGTHSGTGTLQEMEERLAGKGFFRGNKWYLVNYRFIARIDPDQIVLTGGETLTLSRLRRKELLNDITMFIGKENVI